MSLLVTAKRLSAFPQREMTRLAHHVIRVNAGVKMHRLAGEKMHQ
jgi:hypothetical protein